MGLNNIRKYILFKIIDINYSLGEKCRDIHQIETHQRIFNLKHQPFYHFVLYFLYDLNHGAVNRYFLLNRKVEVLPIFDILFKFSTLTVVRIGKL